MDDLIENVIKWADEKGILENATAQTQLLKSYQELGELAEAFMDVDKDGLIDAIGDIMVTQIILSELIGHGFKGFDNICDFRYAVQNKDRDEFGKNHSNDIVELTFLYGQLSEFIESNNATMIAICQYHILLILIKFSKLCKTTIEKCLQVAYDEIKGRTGKMENGMFVKDK